MSDKTSVGRRVSSFSVSPAFLPFTGVEITVDDETTYSAGNATGRVLKVNCPWGTQAIANAILTDITGFIYQPYTASDARIDPAAEIGDGLNVNGYYGVLASCDSEYDPLFVADVSAPDGGELLSEYPYLPPITRKVQFAQSQAQRARVVAQAAQTTADEAADDAENANNIITAWRYPGAAVEIDGSNIKAGTVMASELLGGTVGLLNASETQVGTMTITGSSSASFAIELSSGGALRLMGDGGAVYLGASGGGSLQIDSEVRPKGNLRPNSTGTYSLGTSAYKWSEIWCTAGAINTTSDRKEKHDINYDIEKYIALFEGLKPVSYIYNDDTKEVTHLGFIAQDVEDRLTEIGLTEKDFAGLVKAKNEDGTITYALRYTEFIALLVAVTKKQEEKINDLENRLNRLEAMLNG